ncbi:MAG: XisI protein [Spirochaetota bacterium]
MDKLNQYTKIIEQFLQDHSQVSFAYGDIQTELVIDPVRNHFILFRIGWEEESRVYHPAIHLQVKDNQVHIQNNTTEIEIVDELERLGIPKKDIITGYIYQPEFA